MARAQLLHSSLLWHSRPRPGERPSGGAESRPVGRDKIKKLAEVVEEIAAGTEKAKALHEEREKANVLA